MDNYLYDLSITIITVIVIIIVYFLFFGFPSFIQENYDEISDIQKLKIENRNLNEIIRRLRTIENGYNYKYKSKTCSWHHKCCITLYYKENHYPSHFIDEWNKIIENFDDKTYIFVIRLLSKDIEEYYKDYDLILNKKYFIVGPATTLNSYTPQIYVENTNLEDFILQF